MQQIPKEGKLFQVVDKNWKQIMKHCVKDSKVLVKTVVSDHKRKKRKPERCTAWANLWFFKLKVVPATSMPGLLDILIESNNLLEVIMKGLNAYLEKKRLYFPR